jgi:hypothetical protein
MFASCKRPNSPTFFVSSHPLHRREPASALALLRTSWNWQDDQYLGNRPKNLRTALEVDGPGAERLGRQRNRCCEGADQELCQHEDYVQVPFERHGAILFERLTCRYLFHSNNFKLIILDEADNMTQTAQNALRRGTFPLDSILIHWFMLTSLSFSVIEKYTRNVRFCLICNYASKIIPALQSRCTRFRFAPLKLDQIKNRIDQILEKEKWVQRRLCSIW